MRHIFILIRLIKSSLIFGAAYDNNYYNKQEMSQNKTRSNFYLKNLIFIVLSKFNLYSLTIIRIN